MKCPVLAQRGVALIAVLWLVAAMSLIIGGVVQAIRSETQTTGLSRHSIIANSLADAAILLALQNLQATRKEPHSSIQVMSVPFEGQTFDVSIQSLNGMIDINNAAVMLLAEMYRHAGGLSPAAAQTMARATVDLRQSKSAKGGAQGFAANEDLLRVPDMTYSLYDKIRHLVTADLKGGSGRVNPIAAPVGVLQILTGGDAARAGVLAASRNADPTLMDASFLKPELIEMSSSRSLRLQVQVSMPDGGSLQRTWYVYWGSDPRSALPWRVLGTEQTIRYSVQSDT